MFLRSVTLLAQDKTLIERAVQVRSYVVGSSIIESSEVVRMLDACFAWNMSRVVALATSWCVKDGTGAGTWAYGVRGRAGGHRGQAGQLSVSQLPLPAARRDAIMPSGGQWHDAV